MTWVNCSECIYFDDCENKENRDGCYFGDIIDTSDDNFAANNKKSI